MTEAMYFFKLSKEPQSASKFICPHLEYFIELLQELSLRDVGSLEAIASQTFVEPNFAFMVLTKDYHFGINVERAHSINQSFKTND